MDADWKTSELVIWQSFVLDPADWENDVSGKEIRVPFPADPRQEETVGVGPSFFVRSSPENPLHKQACAVTPAGEEVVPAGVEVRPVRMPSHGKTAEQEFYWFAVSGNQDNLAPGIFLTEPQAGIDMFLPLTQEDPTLCSNVALSPDGDEAVLEFKTALLSSLAVYNMEQEQVVLTVPDADTPVWMDHSRFAYMALDPVRKREHSGSAWCSVAFCERLGEEIKQETLHQATETTDYLLLDATPGAFELRILKIIVDSPEDWGKSGGSVEDIHEPYPACG
jgi:hypothetical protein